MKVLGILVAAPLFAATTAIAQPPASRTDSGCVTGPDGRVECRFNRIVRGSDSVYRFERSRMDSMMMKRPVLGLELRATGTKRDTLGVFVENVVPGGPADKAGIVEGDRIAGIDGTDLRVSAADVEDPYTNGLAAHRLGRAVEKLTPGARVNLRVSSGGRVRDVPVTVGRASDLPHRGMGFNMDGPGMFHFEGPGMGMMLDMPQMLDGVKRMIAPGRIEEPMARRFEMEPPGGDGGPGGPGARRVQLRAPLMDGAARMRMQRAIPMRMMRGGLIRV